MFTKGQAVQCAPEPYMWVTGTVESVEGEVVHVRIRSDLPEISRYFEQRGSVVPVHEKWVTGGYITGQSEPNAED